MKFSILIFILLLACMYPSLAQGSYENCCLKHATRMRNSVKKRVQKYMIQTTDGGCNLPAVIFQLNGPGKRASFICTDPKMKWVQDLVTAIRERSKSNQRKSTPQKANNGA